MQDDRSSILGVGRESTPGPATTPDVTYPVNEPDGNLDDARARIRAELIGLTARLIDEDGLEAGIAELADAYTTLGGDLELPDKHAEAAELDLKRLRDHVRRLEDATQDVALEDFPPRLIEVGDAINALLEAGR